MRRALLLILCLVWAAGPLRAADDVVVTLLHTNDMHGRVHLPGEAAGLSKLATLVETVRGQMPHVLLLDAGDTISGQPECEITHGEGIIAAMNAIGFDAAAVGNHEFDRGNDVAMRTMRLAEFDVLTNNIVHAETGEQWPAAKPYTVLEIAGVRVGVFGLTTPNTMVYQYPRSMAGYTVPDPIAAARESVRKLREEERADAVIALSHWGYKGDQRLAKEAPGIDIILGGHTHTTLEEQVWVGKTLIMQTGAHAEALGRADLWLRPRGDGKGHELVSINGADGKWWGHDGAPSPEVSGVEGYAKAVLTRPTASTPDHAGVMAAYAPFEAKTNRALDEVLAQVAEPISGAGAEAGETALGNLLADAIREHGDADVAVMASSQFKPIVLETGPVTLRDMYEISGAYTRQHVVTVSSPGKHVRAMLQSTLAEPGKFPLHISGAEVTPEGVTLELAKPLEDDQIYRVAGAAHVLQEHFLGTDKIAAKPDVTVIYDDPAGATVRQALAAYLKELREVTPPTTGRVLREPLEATALKDGIDAGPRKATP